MAETKYAEWLDELFERGFYLSEFKKLLKEKFSDKDMNLLWRFIHRRRKQGWRIEIKREGRDTYYRVISKPEKRRSVETLVDEFIDKVMMERDEKGSERGRGERVLCGMGVYRLRREGDRSVVEVRVGTESKVVECGGGDDVVEVLRRLCGVDVEVKKVEKVGEVERGVFGLYVEV